MLVTEMFFRNGLRPFKQNIHVQSKAKVYAQTHLNTFSIRLLSVNNFLFQTYDR